MDIKGFRLVDSDNNSENRVSQEPASFQYLGSIEKHRNSLRELLWLGFHVTILSTGQSYRFGY